MAKKISQLTELASGVAVDDYLALLDTSANVTKKVKVSTLVGVPDFGWTATGETHTYSAWDSTSKIGTITVPTDATTKYTAGMRYRITQSTGGTKYGIIHEVAATTLYVYFGTDYTLNNETITTPYYSSLKTPFGFPDDPDKWTRELRDTSVRQQASPTTGTWYALPSLTLVVGRGKWEISYECTMNSSTSAGGATSVYSTMTSTSAAADTTMAARHYSSVGSGANQLLSQMYRSKIVTLSANTTYYLNAMTDVGSHTAIGTNNSGDTVMRARSAYL